MPNTLAYIALIIWPLIVIYMYKRLPIINATFWTIVGGFLVLPAKMAIDFPLIPPMDKNSISSIFALVGCVFIKKNKIKFLPQKSLERWLVIIVIVMPFFTMLNNQERINFIPGLTLHDAFSDVVQQYLIMVPFIIGVQIIKTKEEQLVLFKLLVVACLCYSVLILYEIRMSPQLHTILYGFFPHSFLQQYRFGGFRAVVFLGHGLIVSMFVAISLGVATILLKEKIKTFGLSAFLVVFFLLLVLLLNKTLGALILGAILFVYIYWMPKSLIRKTTMFLMLAVMFYPLLSMLNYFPHDTLVQWATEFDPSRGESLAYRFKNEQALLEHANSKLFFGWGGWGRNRLEHSVTDGNWITVLGQYGIVGFYSFFGILAVSTWKALKTSVLIKDNNDKELLLSYALIISIIMVDQLPNASLGPWMWLFIGGLCGRANYIKNNAKKIKHDNVSKPNMMHG